MAFHPTLPPPLSSCFTNPLLLGQMRPKLDSTFGSYAGGMDVLHRLLANVRTGLIHGLQDIFFVSAILMSAAVVLHILLKDVKLRHHHAPEPEVPVG